MADLIGHILGPYQIVGEIGHGGMANVYRAVQPSIGREVAIKVLPAHFLQDRTFLERFNREVKVIAQLQHPRILPVYDYGQAEGVPYIVMAYLPGGTLARRIQRDGGVPAGETVRLIGHIAEGLDYAHEQGIIHRDFKPSNVLLDKKGNPYLADFGIAKVAESTAQLTGSGIVGTPAYMAPEMTRRGGVTHLVDVYALGVTLFQMLTGALPYEADTPMGTVLAHVTEPIPDVHDWRPDLPDAMQGVIERAMAKAPMDRYQSAGELAADLDAAIGTQYPVNLEPTAPLPAQASLPVQEAPTVDEPHWASVSATIPLPAPAPAPPPAVERLPQIKPQRKGVSAWLMGVIAVLAVGVVGAVSVGGLALAGAFGGGRDEGTQQAGETATPTIPAATPTATAIPTPAVQGYYGSGETWSVAWSPDGTRIVAGQRNGYVMVWKADDGAVLFTLKEHPSVQATGEIHVAWSPDGTRIASAAWDNTTPAGTTLAIWDAQTGEILRRLVEKENIFYVAFSPDGNTLAAGGGGGSVTLWNVETGQRLKMLQGLSEHAIDIVWSSDGKQVAGGNWSGEVGLWDIGSGVLLHQQSGAGSGANMAGMEWSPDGKLIATSWTDGRVLIWDVENDWQEHTLGNLDEASVFGLAFSPNGRMLAAGASTGLVVFDVQTGEQLDGLPAGRRVLDLAWSPDGTRLAIGSDSVSVWTLDPA